MRLKSRALIIVASILFAALVIPAQSDDWYQNHQLKNRWEGLFGENQGSPEYEVRSFTAGVEPYPTDKNHNVDLKLKYYVPDSSEACIKATTINHDPSYRMEPRPAALQHQIGWRYFEGWSTKDVLVPNRIPSENLGVVIRLGGCSDAIRLLAPAAVYSSGKPSLSTYRLDLFTATATNKSSFTVIGANKYSRKYDLPRANARSVIPIRFDATEIPEGLTRVNVTLNYEDSSTRTLEWKFYKMGSQ